MYRYEDISLKSDRPTDSVLLFRSQVIQDVLTKVSCIMNECKYSRDSWQSLCTLMWLHANKCERNVNF